MNPLESIRNRAKANLQRIVLPEGTELRTLTAANQVLEEKIAKIVLLGNREEILKIAEEHQLSYIKTDAEIINPAESDKFETYAQLLAELRKKKGMTIEQAREITKDPLYFGCLMMKSGDVDGQLAGAENTTGNVLKPALQIVKTKPGIRCVSSALMLITTQHQYGEDGIVMVGDVAVMPLPTAEELATIAVSTGETMRAIGGIEPRIAMLSFSTKGSAKHENVDKVVRATKLAQEMAPDMAIDGELQTDAALVPSIGTFKAPGSKVAGHANTLIFPSIEIGNIAYKMVERLGGAIAVGPVLQGMALPINDLSRGCSVADIYNMIAITANQAIAAKK